LVDSLVVVRGSRVLEIPEVEVLRKDLEKEVVGKKIKDVNVLTTSIVRPFHRTRPDLAKALTDRKIEGVRRRGTILFLDLDEEHTWILNLGPSSSVHRETANEKPGPDTHFTLAFSIGGALHITDAAKDTEISTGVVATQEALEQAEVDPASFDPLVDSLTWMDFGARLAAASSPLKFVMTDRSVVEGIGQVYVDEILYEAGLRWDRPSDKLSSQEVRRLYRAMHEVIAAAMKFRGTSLDDASTFEAVDEDGEPAEHLKVFGRDGRPSMRSRKPIVRDRIKKGIYTYYDPQSQV
jgi:formamidopyrimidine-DNA glycosylase